jgi:metal-responsive CopG/Arc/MetJ family transcriptional regulator
MKTAISVQTNLYKRAEKFAKDKKISRSKLYSDAVQDYLDKHESERIIERINKVCEEVDTSIDPIWKEAQSRVLVKEEW